MHTNRAETCSISIQAPPDAVVDFVADARTLPRWAPAFARAVRPDGADWLVDTGEAEIRVPVNVSRERGTVDIVGAADPRRGVFTRVLANGEGSEYLFTQFFPDGTSEEAIARQLAVVEGELRAVRDACEAR
jgi:hypothetical protein